MTPQETLEAAATFLARDYHERSKVDGTYADKKSRYEWWEMPQDPKLEDFKDNWGEVTESLDGKDGVSFEWDGQQHFVKELDQHGGEGQGDQYYYIYEIDGKAYKLEAYYASWEGVYWDEAELYEVKEKQVTVTTWVKA